MTSLPSPPKVISDLKWGCRLSTTYTINPWDRGRESTDSKKNSGLLGHIARVHPLEYRMKPELKLQIYFYFRVNGCTYRKRERPLYVLPFSIFLVFSTESRKNIVLVHYIHDSVTETSSTRHIQRCVNKVSFPHLGSPVTRIFMMRPSVGGFIFMRFTWFPLQVRQQISTWVGSFHLN